MKSQVPHEPVACPHQRTGALAAAQLQAGGGTAEARPDAEASLAQSHDALANRSPHALQLRQQAGVAAASPAATRAGHAQHVADGSPRAVQLMRHAAAAAAPGPNNTGLPDGLKAGIESLSGVSMDQVKVHYNSNRPARLQAHAYARGSEIHLAPGQERHLPHEAWHVVQQAQGRVRPTMQMKVGVSVNNDVALEREADAMGARAASLGTTAQLRVTPRARTANDLGPATHAPLQLQTSSLAVKSGTAYRGDGRAPATIFAQGFVSNHATDGPLPETMSTNDRPDKYGYTNGLPIVSTSRDAATALNYSWGLHAGGYLYVCNLDGLRGYDFDAGGQNEVAMETIPGNHIRLAIGPYETKLRTIAKTVLSLGVYCGYLACTDQNWTEDVDIISNPAYGGGEGSEDMEGVQLIKRLKLRQKADATKKTDEQTRQGVARAPILLRRHPGGRYGALFRRGRRRG